MTLKEFARVDSYYRDLNTGMEMPWREYMYRIIYDLGIEDVAYYIPFGYQLLKEKLKEDVHLNNTEYSAWLHAAGFKSHINRKTKAEEIIPLHSGLAPFLRFSGITCVSPAECVSILKETARILCEENV